ncbi:hypothetical protein BH23THE1_BH23THE1_29280 [soil metagenome]
MTLPLQMRICWIFNQGLIMHAMGGFNVILVKEVFKIPDDYEVGIIIAIGYQGTNDILREKFPN